MFEFWMYESMYYIISHGWWWCLYIVPRVWPPHRHTQYRIRCRSFIGHPGPIDSTGPTKQKTFRTGGNMRPHRISRSFATARHCHVEAVEAMYTLAIARIFGQRAGEKSSASPTKRPAPIWCPLFVPSKSSGLCALRQYHFSSSPLCPPHPPLSPSLPLPLLASACALSIYSRYRSVGRYVLCNI